MKIACLSGKGGAGKTLIAVNLAAAAGKAVYIDCDVEEPNGRLFLKPENVQEYTVSSLLPDFHADRCTGCKKCVQFCRFHALMYIKEKPMLFPEVCHSCGGCMMVCPEHAITEKPKPVGTLEIGNHGSIRIVSGILNPGEASGIPVIREALKQAQGPTIIDCPPGSACSVMESIMDADYCVLVAEPTAFGFHNFKMVHELAALLGRKCGVVINKQETPYEPLEQFCAENSLPVLARIPYDPEIAALTADGQVVFEKSKQGHRIFTELFEKIGGAL
ncbi:MAG: ATP-binding protein [Lachnospiraceae bacterium]|nr:ATP-binding protein [Lachnospiraceae bacterium]MDY4970973.1 ATP-binding protein [Lachnospiraceae bacterium]